MEISVRGERGREAPARPGRAAAESGAGPRARPARGTGRARRRALLGRETGRECEAGTGEHPAAQGCWWHEPPRRRHAETEILGYYDLLATLDRAPDSMAERLDHLVTEICLAALQRDRDFFAAVVRTGIERGRGAGDAPGLTNIAVKKRSRSRRWPSRLAC